MSFRLIDLSMAPHHGVWWKWWTVLRLSQTVEEVCHRLSIIVLSLKDATMDRARVRGIDASVGDHLTVGAIVPHLDQGVHVGVVRGVVVHAPSMGHHGAHWGILWTLSPTVHQGFSMIHSAAPILNKESS